MTRSIDLERRIASAKDFVQFLGLQAHGKALPGCVRSRATAACFSVAQEHHNSIVVLLDHQLYGSAFALVRPLFESYLRGEWLNRCASEPEVEAFANGVGPQRLDMGAVVSAVAREIPHGDKLSEIKVANWSSMCDYAHTGSLQVQRRQSEEAVEPKYDDDEVLEVLKFAEFCGTLATLGTLGLSGAEATAERVEEVFLERA